MPNEVKLLPCPFCGSTSLSIDVSESKYPGLCVTCNCGAEGPAYGSDAAAITAWNTRPTTLVTDEVVERVAAAIDEALPESDQLSLAPSQIRRAAKAAIEAMPTVVTGER